MPKFRAELIMLMLTKNLFSLVVGWPSNSRCDVNHNVLQTLHMCSLCHYVQRTLNTQVMVACCKENAMAGQGEIPTPVKRVVLGPTLSKLPWCSRCKQRITQCVHNVYSVHVHVHVWHSRHGLHAACRGGGAEGVLRNNLQPRFGYTPF